MARITYLERRGAVYYARVDIPLELVEHYGTTTKKKSLRTKDENAAKKAMWPVVEAWRAEFEDVRARRQITADDKAAATWQHYEAVLDRDEAARRALPTEAQINAALKTAIADAEKAGLDAADPVAMLGASLEVRVLNAQKDYEAEARAVKLKTLRQHLASGETALIGDEVTGYVAGNKLLPNAADTKDIARRMIRAEIEGLERTLERDRGDYSGAPKDPIVKPISGAARQTAAPGESIMEVFKIYERENPNGTKPDTLAQARRDIGTFVDYVGSTCPVHRIDKKAVREWKALLLQYPVKATETKAFEGMKIAQIVKHNEKVGKPAIARNTVNRYLSSLGAFCGWLMDHGYLHENPVADMFMKKDTDKKVYPFTVEQMNTLFKSPFFTGVQSDDAVRFWNKPGNVSIRDHRYWVPLIMAFSGARPGEVAQLAVSDVREDRGHWIMHITEEGEGDKSTKNEGSMRVVPLHPMLVKLGLIDYHAKQVEAGEKRLFPTADRNSRGQMFADFSRDFGRYLTKLGLKDGRGLSLYSFRHSATDALRRAGYLDEQFGFILGHTKATMTGRYGILPQGMLEQRVELINAIKYPDLKIDHLF
ncbi:integrase [Rhizobium sp. SG_E_25_P2]|uniref:site-specific integrase n=1 Tax=Rhizobium sp. SG_E_25_P2 TaxID=2879942 RepID=UPI002475622A|nr:site-specific integrase [Rhizobium sp. SG_E_25_P2]MDH6265634.1 integrase [Rhizobium sp. SG_E_25_P2]